MPDTKGQHDQSATTEVLADEAHQFELDGRLVQTKGCEDRAPPAGKRPSNDGAAVRRQVWIDLGVIDLEAGCRRNLHLRLEELLIVGMNGHALLRRLEC